MKKVFFVFIAICLFLNSCKKEESVDISKPDIKTNNPTQKSYHVSREEAILVAQRYHEQMQWARGSNDDSRDIESIEALSDNGRNTLYLLNYKDEKGFCLVGATKQVAPIFAYAIDGNFSTSELNDGVREWLDITRKGIYTCIEAGVKPADYTSAFWDLLASEPTSTRISSTCAQQGTTGSTYFSTGQFIHPIAQWGASGGANYYSPYDPSCNCAKKSSGCAATAMAQVMRYYQYPIMMMSNGTAWAYTNYPLMPLKSSWSTCLTNPPPSLGLKSIALLEYTCGLWANTNYGVLGNCSSWTIPGNINNAFEDLYYSNGGTWGSLSSKYPTVKNELKNYKPVVFCGTTGSLNIQNAHIWVGDGYQYSGYYYDASVYNDNTMSWDTYCEYYQQELIAMNWGWNGAHNGWYNVGFAFSAGQNTYDTWLRALTGIRP